MFKLNLILFALVVSGGVDAMTRQQLKNSGKMMKKSCMPKNDVTEDQVGEIANGKFIEDRNVMCYIACIFQMSQLGLSSKSKQVLQAKILPVFLKCCDEFNFSMDEIAEVKRHKKNIESKNACFYACVFKKTGVIDENGLLSEEKARSQAKIMLSDEEDLRKSQELMHECAEVNEEPVSDGKKGCDRAMLVANCLLKRIDKFGLTP